MTRLTPIKASAIFTAVALLTCLLVWRDNQVGFRDAGAMADLIAALFAMISVIWLVCTVFLQRIELALQRDELQLQREEIARLASASESQNEILLEQSRTALKINLTSVLQGLVRIEWNSMKKELDAGIKELVPLVRERGEHEGDFRKHKATPSGVSFNFGSIVDGTKTYVPYDEVAEHLGSSFQISTLVRLAKVAKENQILRWYTEDLAFLIDLSSDDAANLYIILNAVAVRLEP